MRDKFLFGLNEFFARFREDIFHTDGQQKGFHLGFRGQSNPITWKRLNKQTNCWQPLLLKNSSIIMHLRSPTKASQNPLEDLEQILFFSGIENNNTLESCAQRPEKSAATATKPAISHTFVSRPSELRDPPVPPPKTQLHRDPAGRHSVWELLYPLRKTTS